jgi:hypothetical protein
MLLATEFFHYFYGLNLISCHGHRIILIFLGVEIGLVILVTELFENCYGFKFVWCSWLPSYFKIVLGWILFDAHGSRIFLQFLGVEIGLGFLATELFQNLSCIKVGFVLLVNLFE